MNFKDYLKGVWQRLFPIKDIKTALNIKVAMSQEMLGKIELWQRCYTGNAPWTDEIIKSLRLEQATVVEFSNVVLNEMTVNITNKKLEEIYNKSTEKLDIFLQRGLASGAMIIKPLGESKVQCVGANAFIPIEYDSSGRLLKVVFPDFKKLKDNYYTRLEYHDLDPITGLTITNKAYVSTSPNVLGREIPLNSVEEWTDIEPLVRFPKMFKPAFAYYCNPIDNTVDNSHCGVSVFDSAIEMYKKTDVQFGRLDWEFESGERAIHADVSMLKDGKLQKHNKRLYRGVIADDEELLKEYSPEFRQSDIIAGLEEYKRNIEFTVGLAYGDLSNPSQVEKTATEIISAKQRKYNRVKAIQKNLSSCLEDLVYALAFYNCLTTSGYKFSCTFKDSILIDEKAEREQDMKDVAMGAMRIEEYRAKYYNEDLETALQNLPQKADVIE